jgi:hypothetical protein
MELSTNDGNTANRLAELRDHARWHARAAARYAGLTVLSTLVEADALATPTSSTTGIRIVLALIGAPGAAYMMTTERLEHAELDRRIVALEAIPARADDDSQDKWGPE